MGIFDGNLENVSGTKIFATVVHPAKLEKRKDSNGREKTYKVPVGNALQMIIYSNKVQLEQFNYDQALPGIKVPRSAMVLPFPLISGKNRFRILDMSKYHSFFDHIDMIFPTDKGEGFRAAANEWLLDSEENLEIQHVGNYKVSVVSSLDKFD